MPIATEISAGFRCCLSENVSAGRVHNEGVGAEILTGGRSSGSSDVNGGSLRVATVIFVAFFLFLVLVFLLVLVVFCASGTQAIGGHRAISGCGKPSGKDFVPARMI